MLKVLPGSGLVGVRAWQQALFRHQPVATKAVALASAVGLTANQQTGVPGQSLPRRVRGAPQQENANMK